MPGWVWKGRGGGGQGEYLLNLFLMLAEGMNIRMELSPEMNDLGAENRELCIRVLGWQCPVG